MAEDKETKQEKVAEDLKPEKDPKGGAVNESPTSSTPIASPGTRVPPFRP